MHEFLTLVTGFYNASELAKKTTQLFGMCKPLISNNFPISNDVDNIGECC
jgi:hypothetical protein